MLNIDVGYFGVRCSTFDVQMPAAVIRLTSTYEPVHRFPLHGLSGTPSAPIGVVPSNIASGCVSAVAIFPGLMPRGYILPSLTGFCPCPEQDITPFLLLSQSFIHSSTNSIIQTPTCQCSGAASYGFQCRALKPDKEKQNFILPNRPLAQAPVCP
jgi:hypothetical protein